MTVGVAFAATEMAETQAQEPQTIAEALREAQKDQEEIDLHAYHMDRMAEILENKRFEHFAEFVADVKAAGIPTDHSLELWNEYWASKNEEQVENAAMEEGIGA